MLMKFSRPVLFGATSFVFSTFAVSILDSSVISSPWYFCIVFFNFSNIIWRFASLVSTFRSLADTVSFEFASLTKELCLLIRTELLSLVLWGKLDLNRTFLEKLFLLERFVFKLVFVLAVNLSFDLENADAFERLPLTVNFFGCTESMLFVFLLGFFLFWSILAFNQLHLQKNESFLTAFF